MGCRVVSLPLVFSVALMVATLGTIAQSQTPPGTWTQKAPMPAVRGEVAAAAVGDKLFALGGGVAGKAVARLMGEAAMAQSLAQSPWSAQLAAAAFAVSGV